MAKHARSGALIDALVAARRAADATRHASRARVALADAGLEPGPSLRAAEARALGIGTARLVTLVGPGGGVGKTRLAVELAARVIERHRLRTRLVELGALTDPDDVAGAIASGLGVDRLSIDEALTSAHDLEPILVIDNAEHVAAAAARVISLLASGNGSLRIVVTSRERLAVDGEHVRAVRPLPSYEPTSPAQVLLCERSVAAGAAPDELDPEMISRVVRRLDGLPLAIEMAAAQLTSCSLAELLTTLDRRVVELSAPSTSVPPRHQSLAALIDWSVVRLDPADVALLHQLTVFAGPFTAEDVAGVLGDDAMVSTRRLADRSLVTAAVSISSTTFRVLYVVRDQIHRRVGALPDDLRAAHTRWYLAKARSAVTALMSRREPSGHAALNEMLDELRAAHRWATDHDRQLALALSAVIHPFAQSSLNDELLSWADRVVAGAPRQGDDPDDVAIAMASSATRMAHGGDHIRGADLARRALAVAETVDARLPALETLADAMLAEGELDDSDPTYQQLIDEAGVAGNGWYGASATGVLLVAA
ncbi:MAG: hypothetical protein ACFCVK_18710 [Acidimicrobiales bacterium]